MKGFPWSAKMDEALGSVFKLDQYRPHQLESMNAFLSGHDVVLVRVLTYSCCAHRQSLYLRVALTFSGNADGRWQEPHLPAAGHGQPQGTWKHFEFWCHPLRVFWREEGF